MKKNPRFTKAMELWDIILNYVLCEYIIFHMIFTLFCMNYSRSFITMLKVSCNSLRIFPFLDVYVCIGLFCDPFFFSFFVCQASLFYAWFGFDLPSWWKFSFTLAAATKSNSSRTSKRVWGDNERVILLCVLRRSRSSHVWRLCRVSEGLSLDYG